jgi:hypothetical protein
MLPFRAVSRSYFSTQAIKSFAIPNAEPKRKNLIGITYQELQSELASIPGIKAYTADQIWSFMYKQGKLAT